MKKILLGLCLAIGSPSVFATPFSVVGSCSDFGMSYYGYTFQIDYDFSQNPKAEQVELFAGFAGQGSVDSRPARDFFHWDSVQSRSFKISQNAESSRLSFELKHYYMATGGFFSDLELAAKVTLKDGTVIWDLSEFSEQNVHERYSAHFFSVNKLECWHLRNPLSIPVAIKQ